MPVAEGVYFHLAQDGVLETPPVVLLHGVGGMHLFWPPQVRRLPGYRVFAIDLPGHGKSGRGGLQSIGAYAEQVLAWMDAVHVHRAVFVGHSMGGAIALTLGMKHPERVLGLGVLSTALRMNFPMGIVADAANGTTFFKAVDRLAVLTFGSAASESLKEQIASRWRETRPSVFHGDLLACEQVDFTEGLSSIRKPALILCGSEDPLTPTRNAHFMTDVIQNAILEIFPRAGHMVMLEYPEQVGQSLARFLNQIPYHAG